MRDKNGRFLKGNAGGPGRPSGYRSRIARLLDNIDEDDLIAMRDHAVAQAKDGWLKYQKLIFERLWPVPKGRTVRFELPEIKTAADIPSAITAVLSAMANGEVPVEEGLAFISALNTARKAYEAADNSSETSESSSETEDE